MKKISILFIMCVILFSVYAQDKSIKTEFIQYEELEGNMLVKVFVNGKSTQFMLDLAGKNMILPEMVDLLKALPDEKRGGYKIGNISIGNNVFSNSLNVLEADDDDAGFLRKAGVAGTINNSIFYNVTLTIDKRGKRLITSIPHKPAFMRITERTDCNANTDGHVVFNLLLDGKAQSVVFDSREKAIVRLSDNKSVVTSDVVLVNVKIPQIRVEPENGQQFAIHKAIVGLGLLDYGLISFDYQRSKIYFQSYENTKMIEESAPTLKEIIPGKLNEITKDEFVKYIYDYKNGQEFLFKGDKPVVIDFWASWCGPCMKLLPAMQQFAEKYKDQVVFYKVNADVEKELCAVFGVTALPTLFFIPVGGKPIVDVGALPEKYQEIIENKLLK